MNPDLNGVFKGVDILVVDLDNTLFDCLSMIKCLYPEYEPMEQVSYKFSHSKYLDLFSRVDFYDRGLLLNNNVVKLLFEAQRRGIKVHFISASPSDEIHEVKGNLLSKFFKFDFEFFKVSFDAEYEVSQFDKETSLFIDDAPDRLRALSNGGFKFIRVSHLYNEEFVNSVLNVSPDYRDLP